MKDRKDILAVALLLLVIIIRFSPFVFAGYPLNTDSWKNYLPWKTVYSDEKILTVNYDSNMEYGTWFPMVKEELAHGRFPLWNPYSGCGMPMYVDHLIPVFHIPFAIALLFPGDLVNSAYAFLMAITGTLFFYWFLRNWKFSVFVSLFGGMVFFLSGWQMYLYPPEVASLIWIPAILLFYDRFLESRKLSDAGWAAFFIGQLLIGGYPAYIAHFFYVVVVYMLWRKFNREFEFKISTKRWLAGIVLMAVFGILISAVQNYPTWQFMKLTNRNISSESKVFAASDTVVEPSEGTQTSEQQIDKSLKAKLSDYIDGKKTILFVSFRNNLDVSRNFVGPIVMLLVLFGLIYGSRKFLAMKLMCLIFGMLALLPPLFSTVALYIPGWTISALLPRDALYFLVFFMAAVGLDRILSSWKKVPQIGMLFLVISIWISSAILAGATDYGHRKWSLILDTLYLFPYSIFSLGLTIIIIRRIYNRKLSISFEIVTLSFFLVSSVLAHFYLFPYFHSKSYMPETEAITTIKQTCTNGRIVRYGSEPARLSFTEQLVDILPPNIPSRFQIMDSLCYDSMILANYEQLMDTTAPGSVIRGRGSLHIQSKESLQPDSDFMKFTGTRYILEKTDEVDPYDLSIPHVDIEGIRIYNLSSGDNSNPYISTYPDYANLNVLEFERRTNSTLDAVFEVDHDCSIIIADTYHPLWRATLDGNEIEIKQANIAFREISVPSGKHTLHMWFDPVDLKLGGIVSGISLLVLMLICLVDKKIKME